MKTISIMGLLLVSFSGLAQTDPAENMEKVQQEPLSSTRMEVERSATRDAKKISDKELQAKRQNQERGQTQKQTKTQPAGLPPNLTDTVAKRKLERQQRN